MKRKQYTGPQIAFALQQAEAGTPVADICGQENGHGHEDQRPTPRREAVWQAFRRRYTSQQSKHRRDQPVVRSDDRLASKGVHARGTAPLVSWRALQSTVFAELQSRAFCQLARPPHLAGQGRPQRKGDHGAVARLVAPGPS
jgi:hypothetical protein